MQKKVTSYFGGQMGDFVIHGSIAVAVLAQSRVACAGDRKMTSGWELPAVKKMTVNCTWPAVQFCEDDAFNHGARKASLADSSIWDAALLIWALLVIPC